MSTPSTTPHYVLYDGHCIFCTHGAKRLCSLAKSGTIELLDFQQPGVLERFPSLTYDACMAALQLVTPDGRIYSGCEGIVQSLVTRPVLGKLVRVYYIPGIRHLCNWAYRWIASNRYLLMGKKMRECSSGTCSIHFGRPKENKTG